MISAKLTREHLARKAIVYVRQSTTTQVRENLESQRRQYALADHARSLGFGDVEVIDQDLGHSGASLAGRLGFQRLVAQVSLGAVGVVLCLEASRLARNNRDWHHLIDLCSLVGTLLIDPEGVYDPRVSNDRLLLGLKGTMSEFELALFRQRSLEARHQKARRGELRFIIPVGFQWASAGVIEKTPDRRIQQALELVFAKFRELGSVRQTWFWLREQQLTLPQRAGRGLNAEVVWASPSYGGVLSLLNNPIYAGAYVFGRTRSHTAIVEERAHVTRGHKKPRSEWTVLIRGHHPGYLTWEEYEHNQRIVAENTNMKGRIVRGSPRPGGALLAGLLRCARCGRKLRVNYSGKTGVATYRCRGTVGRCDNASCLSLRGTRLEGAVEEEILTVLEPGAIEAAVAAGQAAATGQDEQRRAVELELEQARYQAERSFRQYDVSDPENRLVTGELERRWNEMLARVRALEERLWELEQAPRPQPAIDPGAARAGLGLRARVAGSGDGHAPQEAHRAHPDRGDRDRSQRGRRHHRSRDSLERRGPLDAPRPEECHRPWPRRCREDCGDHRAAGGTFLRRGRRRDPQPDGHPHRHRAHLERRPHPGVPQLP